MNSSQQFLQLESLIELSAALHKCEDEHSILKLILLTLMGKLASNKVCVMLNSNNEQKIVMGKVADKLSDQTIFDFQSSMGKIIIGKQLREGKDDESFQYCNIIASIGSHAILNVRARNEILKQSKVLQKTNQLLNTLFEMNGDFALARDEYEVLRLTGYLLMGQLRISTYALIGLVDQRPTVLVNKTSESDEEILLLIDRESQKFLSIPFKSRIVIIGWMICFPQSERSGFSDHEMEFLKALGHIAGNSLENIRLLKEEIKKQSIEKELSYAKSIQEKLFPVMPTINGMDLYAVNIPSKEIGGDYYDIVELSNGKVLLIIADVAGKGLPAALIMANMQSAFRVLARADNSPAEIMKQLNAIIYQNTAPDIFITACCCSIQLETLELVYCNAGHNPPIIITKEGKSAELTVGGIILGVLEESPQYQEGKCQLHQGDTLFLYTDGLTEFTDYQGKQLGVEIIKEIVLSIKPSTAKQGVYDVMKKLSTLGEINENQDDITMLMARF